MAVLVDACVLQKRDIACLDDLGSERFELIEQLRLLRLGTRPFSGECRRGFGALARETDSLILERRRDLRALPLDLEQCEAADSVELRPQFGDLGRELLRAPPRTEERHVRLVRTHTRARCFRRGRTLSYRLDPLLLDLGHPAQHAPLTCTNQQVGAAELEP
jgi:hypothetical protein